MERGIQRSESLHRAYSRMVVITIVLWTAVCAGSMAYHIYDTRRHIRHIASETARASIEKDKLFRLWAARHGGVYVPATKETPPNPYLSSLKERDITSPSGRKLTLMNPAYMTRQVHELGKDVSDLQGHITSLKPIRPENAPDAWEAQALKAIEAGAKEFGEEAELKGVRYYRLMLPLFTGQPCLKCHEAQGFKLGDLRGGISASIPMSVMGPVTKDHLRSEAKHFGVVWLLGLAGIGAMSPFVRRRIQEQEKAEVALRRNLEFTRSIIENEPECVKILGPEGELKFMNRAGLAMIDAEGPEQVLGGKVQDLVVPEHREAFIRLNERVFAGESGTLEFEMAGLKGSRRWLETHAVPLRDAAGKVESLLGITRDITHRKRSEQALQDSEERYRTIVNTASEGIMTLDSENTVTFVNARLADMLGYRTSELLGRPVLDFIHPEERAEHAAQMGLRRAGQGAQYERRFVHRNGNTVWFIVSGAPLRDRSGEFAGAFGMFTDITERKRAEEALQESEVLYRSLVETTSAVAWEVDISTMAFTYIGPQIAQLSGYPPEQWTGFAFWAERIHPDDRTSAVQYCQAETGKGLDHAFEYRMITADGKTVWVRDVVSVIKELERPVALRGSFIDITASKMSEEALRKSEERLREAQQIGRIGNWELDVATKALWWSDEVYAIFGRDRSKGVSLEAFAECIHPDDRERVRGAIQDALRRAVTSWEVEYRIVLESGELRYLYEKATADLDGAGSVLRRRGIVQDITDRKQAELHRERLEQQLLQAQKIESVGRLAGGIAHDINNMLMPVLGYAEMLEHKVAAQGPLRDDVKEITNAAVRIRDLTRQLLAFARKQTLEMKRLDLNAVVSGFSRMLRMTLREDIAVTMRLASTAGSILGDKGQLEQVILNLAVNAQDAMPRGGTFTLETRDAIVDGALADRPGLAPGTYVQLLAIDTGTGMDEETRSKIFEPFFTTKEPGRGTGLGLATVYGIVKQHGGFIDVRSEPGSGTAFTVYLPVTEASAGEAGAPPAVRQARGSETVLVVEDEEQVLRLVSLMLGEHGYRVLTAQSGREALEKASLGKIDLLISDVIMPEMNGKELLERLNKGQKGIKVLFMSGYAADVISSQGILDSGLNFIRKPFSVHELAEKVRQVLDMRGPGDGQG